MFILDSKKDLLCPHCGEGRALPVYWGYLPFDLAYEVERGDALFGGQSLPDDEVCRWACDKCGARW